jgi:cell shape-determining protein MreC
MDSLQLITHISTHHQQILTSLNTIKTTNQQIKDLLDTSEQIIPVFSRIIEPNSNKCKFCTKSALYVDMENKYYCWFHRSQYEE